MPPPRDRMAAMQAQAYFGDEDGYDIPIDEDPAMQEFFRNIEELRDIVSQVQKDIARVKIVQNDLISSPMIDPKSKQELDDTMNSIKKKANTIRTSLKKMELANEEEEKNNPSGAQLRMKKTQHMAVSRTFVEIMTEYNKIQTDFR
jgi:syntaxin 1A